MDPNETAQQLLALHARIVGNMESETMVSTTDQRVEEEPQYTHIDQNEFSQRRHKKQEEEEIVICECKYDEKDPESACGERCLNVLTSTECTPGYCPCGVYCKNQRFQKCEYAKTKLFKTEGRGWGLLANENIKAGKFIIEYCGEVISWKEAKKRSHAYEVEGIRDAFIISLNASESIDATVKGSLARFINHSCQPNCETRKWNVLGEIRVGIFAKQDILAGTELAYDYNFEWYGGVKVRCLCGAPSCSGFLGAKSRGFQHQIIIYDGSKDEKGDTSSRGSGVGSDTAMDSTTQSSTHEAHTYTRGSEVDSECVMDFTSEFTTFEIFKSRESLMLWAREAGKRNGFVVVTVRSDLGGKSLKPRVTLGCERGGKFKVHKERCDKGGKQRCGTGSKKCGCPFTLKGEKLTTGDGWMLKVVCGVHNHALTESLEGHSYAGRLSEEETSLLIDLSKSLVRPKEILNKLKQRDSLNVTTIRTIYNARQRQRVKEKAGRSQMEQLLCKLNEHNYLEWHRSCPISGSVLDLFWAHPVSLELLRVFPTILMMDCTFKTNRYHYPLLEVVGVTSTNMTFSIAFVFLDSEKEDNYVWALNRLRDVLVGCAMPNVIVTDKDLELMRAVEIVFPSARHMLCKWHINKNVLAKCRNLFESKEKWDMFIMKWNVLVMSPTEEDYIQELAVLQSEFRNYTDVLDYVTNTWLNPFRDRFVSAWTDVIMHFGNVASNRAESTHSKLKRQLGLSQGNFEGSFEKIHALLELQHTDIKASFEKCLTVVRHSSLPLEFKHLRGVVSTFALDKVLSQFKLATSIGIDDFHCGCVIRRTHGLPCAHEIAKYKRDCQPIPLDSLDTHWRKLHMSPSSDPVNDNMDVNEFPELELLQQYFLKTNADNRLMLRKRVRELVPSLATLIEPGVKSRTRGQLKERIDMPIQKNASVFELIQSASVDSHSPSVTGGTMDVLKKSTHKQTGLMKEKVYRTLSAKVMSYIDSFPVGLMPYIDQVKDVCDDGNCGFRAVADLVGLGENAYLQVRNDLLTELSSYSAHYGELYGSAEKVRDLAQSLSFFNEGRAPFDRCMTMPDMGHLIASCYKIVLFHFSATQCLTFLPLRSTPVPLSMRRHIAIGLVNDSHYVEEDTYLWEDDDERYSVEKIPLYDSAEDEPSSMLFKTVKSNSEFDVKGMMINVNADSEHQLMSTALVVQSLDSDPMEGVVMEVKSEASEATKLFSRGNQPAFLKKNAMISRIRSNTACRNYHIGSGSISNKRSKQGSSGKLKHYAQKQVDAKSVALLLASNEAQDEILKHEEMRSDAATHLESLYNEIRPAIEEHERDSQDSVATSVAEKWIEACCLKLKTEFDLYSSIVKQVACTPRKASGQTKSADNNIENEIKLLPN